MIHTKQELCSDIRNTYSKKLIGGLTFIETCLRILNYMTDKLKTNFNKHGFIEQIKLVHQKLDNTVITILFNFYVLFCFNLCVLFVE